MDLGKHDERTNNKNNMNSAKEKILMKKEGEHQQDDHDHEKKKKKKGSSIVAAAAAAATTRNCQAEKCGADLREAKQYHRRHKVCEHHAKAHVAIVAGIRQRFCHQCSRSSPSILPRFRSLM